MKTVYQTDLNGLFIGPTTAWRDQVDEDRWLVPFGAVETEPPAAGDHQIAKWTGSEWVLIPDFRGFSYWLADRTRHTIVDAGVEPPDGHLAADPGPTAEQLAETAKAALKAQAQQLLDKSDITVVRCVENGIPVPASWKDWRTHLRGVVKTGVGPIEEAPSYPAGA